ncbi:MAG TPA: DUF2946 family protein [Burkholderiales bacterium]|nr:DUF2946 family protein [Burkholderiales bacterium]
MDEQVLKGMARWPNVPAVFGWLSLDRRGTWLLQGDPIENPVVTSYIGRNYEHDADGRWFFQNGPQRVYVALEYTPFVYRALNASERPLELETHTGQRATALRGAWIDEHGGLLVETEHGTGAVHDRDLEAILPSMIDSGGTPLGEDALDDAMTRLAQGDSAQVWLKLDSSNVQVEPVRSADVPARFGFVAQPEAPPADIAPAR